MWQNKIKTLWQSIRKTNPSDIVCKTLDPNSGLMNGKTYTDLISDMQKLDSLIGPCSRLKIVLLMDKSYFSLVSVLFCLLKGHCFIPIFSGSKISSDTISSVAPDYIFSTNDSTYPFKSVNLRSAFELPAQSSQNFQPTFAAPGDTAYIISTSGTTGRPKLIPITYSNFSAYVENILPIIEDKSQFHLLQNFEISFDPYLFDIVATIFNTSCLIPVSHADTRNLEKLISKIHGPIWISLTPSQAGLIQSLFQGKTFSAVKRSFFLGEKLKTSLCLDWGVLFPTTEMYNMYGPAETTVSISCHKFNAVTDRNTFVPVGKIHSDHEFKLSSANELVIKGPQVFPGYLGSQVSEEWFNTRDVVELIDSNFFVTGRSDFQVKINGRRFQPEEMELALSVAGINGYIVPVTKDEKHKTKTHLVFVTQNQSLNLSELLKTLQPRYDIDFIPKRILYLEKYPTSQNGKIDRNGLAQEALKTDLG